MATTTVERGLPDLWYADEEMFMRNLVSPEEDRPRYGLPPWNGGFSP
jgi:hypothetical protein